MLKKKWVVEQFVYIVFVHLLDSFFPGKTKLSIWLDQQNQWVQVLVLNKHLLLIVYINHKVLILFHYQLQLMMILNEILLFQNLLMKISHLMHIDELNYSKSIHDKQTTTISYLKNQIDRHVQSRIILSIVSQQIH